MFYCPAQVKPCIVRSEVSCVTASRMHRARQSSTITNPYDTMVLNLDTRKNSYASKAHEAASLMLCSIAERKGDMLR